MMKTSARAATIVGGFAVAALVAGCVNQEQKTLQSLDQPINCATAQGDLRVRQSEKTHSTSRVAQGLTAVPPPAGIVVGLLTGTEGTKVEVATGEYNRKIDERMTAIRSKCGVQ